MRITFLGTGAAGGVPLYGCECRACRRAHAEPAHERLPCSILIEDGATRVLVDAGLMDLHRRFAPGTLDAIVLTHYHADHVQGLLHLRWGVGAHIAVIGPPDYQGCADLLRNPGLLRFQHALAFAPFGIGSLTFTPLPLNHSKPTFGYAVEGAHGRLAYLIDTLGLPDETEAFLRIWPADALVVDCTFPPTAQPRNHNDWNAALGVVKATGARSAWMTHVGHGVDNWLLEQEIACPQGIGIAYDGLVLDLAAKDPV